MLPPRRIWSSWRVSWIIIESSLDDSWQVRNVSRIQSDLRGFDRFMRDHLRADRIKGHFVKAIAASSRNSILKEFIDEFMNYLSVERGLAKNTLLAYRRDLDQVHRLSFPKRH